jgi:hypothetical protein
MYAPTAAKPAAYPQAASYARPALWHYAPAPYIARRYGQARAMRAACIAAGYSIAATQGFLQRQAANALAGRPVAWPS